MSCDTGTLPSVDKARRKLLEHLSVRAAREQVPLLEAYGHILANTACASVDVPPADNSAMDGYAIRHADLGNNAT